MNTISSLLKNLRNRTPVGSVEMFAGSTPPTDWLMCDGSAVSREKFASLFAIIGTTYGAGDGTTTFNLPDLRDRIPIGAGSTYALNANGGAVSQTYTPSGSVSVGNTTLTLDQIPSHNHNLTASWGMRTLADSWGPTGYGIAGVSASLKTGNNLATIAHGTANDRADVFNLNRDTNSKGGGQAHNHSGSFSGTQATISTMPPYRGINFIIYAGTTA